LPRLDQKKAANRSRLIEETTMKTMIFAQSELLDEVKALEVGAGIGPKALREALISLLPKSVDAKVIQFYLEDSDDEHAFDQLKEIPHGLRVHLHRLKGIDVTVRYAGRDVRRTFRPSATIQRVKRWAAQEFGISASDAAELMLQVAGTDKRPDVDTHIGALVKFPDKATCFDLVPSTRVNG
jgi:hypothetical protein